MENKTNELISYVNSEWAQQMAQATHKIAHLIMSNKELQDENERLKREISGKTSKQ